jgi:small subunit ribosomal protein S9
MEVINALGRRKTSVARVYLTKGTGNVIVNKKDYKEFFPVDILQAKIRRPFELTNTINQFDVKINVEGGGFNGQAEAIRLGISRALLSVDPEFRTALKSEGLLTRDPRMVERKKPGRPKARKKFQFSKR